MSDPFNLVSNFAQNMPQGQLTAIGGQIGALIAQKRAQEVEAARQSQYQNLFTQFQETQDPSLIPQMQNIAPEKFEGFQKAYDMMDEIERKGIVQNNMEVMGHISAGDNKKAADKLAMLSKAYRESDVEDADIFQKLSREVLAGETKGVMSFLGMVTGTSPEGQEAMQNARAMQVERRAQEKHATDFIEKGVGLEFTDQAHKNRVLVGANKMADAGYAQLFAEMGSVAGGADGSTILTGIDLANYVFKVGNEYTDRIEDYQTTIDAARSIYASVVPDSGFSDDAILKLFNKVLDPDSVVRQNELEATLRAQGKWEEFKNIIPRFGMGVMLNDDTRPKLLEIVKLLEKSAQEKITGVQGNMNPLIDTFIGKDKHNLIYTTAPDEAPIVEETSIQSVGNPVPEVSGAAQSFEEETVEVDY